MGSRGLLRCGAWRTGKDSYLSGSGSSQQSCAACRGLRITTGPSSSAPSAGWSLRCITTSSMTGNRSSPRLGSEGPGTPERPRWWPRNSRACSTEQNYTPVTMAELDQALVNESLIPLRLEVDLDDYDELLIYRRGSRQDTVEIPSWIGLRTKERTITVDKRVVVYARVKPQSWFDDRKIDPADRNLVPDHVSLKQFQNVPRADIEMLLPSTQVGLRLIDSLLVGVPAVASGIAVLVTKLLPTLGLIFLLVGAWLGFRDEQPDIDQAALVILFGGSVTLAGFLFRQWTKLKNRRLEYLKILTENLYVRTVAAGPGVLHTLLSSAEQQEVVEVLLAYRFLLAAPDPTHCIGARRQGREVAARRQPRRHRFRCRRRRWQAASPGGSRGALGDAGAAAHRVSGIARPPLGRHLSTPALRPGGPAGRPRRICC